MMPAVLAPFRGFPAPPNRRHPRLLMALPGLLLVLMAAGCSAGNPSAPAPVVSVQTAPVVRTNLEQWIEAEGILYPLHQAIITPKVAAPIARFYVNRGDRVHAGQLLALLENRDLQAAAVENQGLYQQAQGNYQTTVHATLPQQMQQAQLAVTAARRSLNAEQKIYDSRKILFQQGAIARRDLETSGVTLVQARNQYQIALKHLQALQTVDEKAQQQAATGQLTAARGRYQNAQAQLAYTEIRSPLTGLVTDRPLWPGEQAGPGNPLLTVMDLSRVIARIHIAPAQAQQLQPRDQARLISSDGSQVPAHVMLVSPALDPGGTTVEVWVEANNPGLKLRAGDTVTTRILARTIPHAIVIPLAALLSDPEGGGGQTVMVVGDHALAHQVQVPPGLRTPSQVQILQGLQPGQRVITVGAYGLPDGTRVRVADGSATPSAPTGPGGQS